MQTIKCPNCGTDVPFDPAASVAVCPGCRVPITLRMDASALDRSAGKAAGRGNGGLRKAGIIISILVLLGIAGYFLTTGVILPGIKLGRAENMYKNGNYKEAIRILRELDTRKADRKLDEICDTLEDRVEEEIDAGNYADAEEYYSMLPGKRQDAQTGSFLKIMATNFDDGEEHDLGALYETVDNMTNSRLKKKALELPQLKTVQMLEGSWVKSDNSAITRELRNGKSPESSSYYLRYLNGKYYLYYSEEDYLLWYNITSTSFDELCYYDGSLFWDWHYVRR